MSALSLLLLVMAALGVALPGAVGLGGGRAAGAAGDAPPCPANWTCTQEPGGGTVQVGPTNDIAVLTGAQPWVNIRLYGFPYPDQLYVRYCTNDTQLAATPGASTTYCVNDGAGYFAEQSYVQLATFPDGTSSASFQVPEVTSGTPMQGQVPGILNSPTKKMFCDGVKFKCSVDVTVPNPDPSVIGAEKYTPVKSNTGVIPISFAASPSNCGTPQSVTTASEPGIEVLFPTVRQVACKGQGQPALPIDTSQDGLAALQQLAAQPPSQTYVAFTEDPESPDQQAILTQGHYELIPVALTADVIAFQAQLSQASRTFPQADVNLTGDMVAGVMSNYYKGSTDPNSDVYQCRSDGSNCPSPPCLSGFSDCSLVSQANRVSGPPPGFVPAAQYGGYPRADASGTTDAMTHWLCSAPAGSVTIATTTGTEVVPETMTPAQTMVAGLTANQHPVTTCPVTDVFPPLATGTAYWVSGTSPPDQLAKGMAPAEPPLYSNGQGVDVFAPMNWAWASYLGLGSANLQNGSGSFVGPSAASIDAAVADATQNPDGTITPKYADPSDPSAYVMPAVIYAAVNMDKLATADQQAAASKLPLPQAAVANLLSEILDITGGKDTSSLPVGFVPLTQPLYTQAAAAVQKLVLPSSGGGGGGGNGSGGGGGGGNSSDGAGATASGGGVGLGSGDTSGFGGGGDTGLGGITGATGLGGTVGSYSPSFSAGTPVAAAPAATASSGTAGAKTGGSRAGGRARRHARGRSIPSSSPLYGPIELAASSSRLLLPFMTLLALLGVTFGALFLLWGNFRQKVLGAARRVAAGAPPVPAAAGGGTPAPGPQPEAVPVEAGSGRPD